MISLEDLHIVATAHGWPWRGTRVVLTNGCFDLLHVGHLRYLKQARALGDVLVVALNTDRSVAELKGPSRPWVCLEDRAEMLQALPPVSYVVPFDELRVTSVIEAVRPRVWVKGGDYTLETIDPGERAALEACGAEIVFMPLVEGRSTSGLIERIRGG